MTARRSNQSVVKEISPEYSLEGLMLKLKLQYFSHLMLRTDSFEKTLMLGKIEGGRRRGRQRRRWLDGMVSPTWWTWVWVNSGSWWWTGGLACCDSWGHKELDTTEGLYWIELKKFQFNMIARQTSNFSFFFFPVLLSFTELQHQIWSITLPWPIPVLKEQGS